MIAYVPARGGSKRIPRKNIKPLGGKPIIGHVLDTVKKLSFISKVCVSTDDTEIQDVAHQYGAETGALRDPSLSDDYTVFMSLIRHDIARFAKQDEDVLFVLPTSALIQESHYSEAYEIFTAQSPEILMSVIEFPISPLWALRKGKGEYWQALHPEYNKVRSQDLPETCFRAGQFDMMKWRQVAQYDTYMTAKLCVYKLLPDFVVDVDTPEDWEVLERKYQKLIGRDC